MHEPKQRKQHSQRARGIVIQEPQEHQPQSESDEDSEWEQPVPEEENSANDSSEENSEVSDLSCGSEDDGEEDSDISFVDEDDIFEDDSDDDIDPNDKIYEGGKWWKAESDGSLVIMVWDMFEDKRHFLDVIRDYQVQEVTYYSFLKNDNKNYTAVCSSDKCNWRIHASVLQDRTTFQVKVLIGSHECGRLQNNPVASAPWIAKKLVDDYRATPVMDLEGISNTLMDRYGILWPWNIIRKARYKMIEMVYGKHEDGYLQLARYSENGEAIKPWQFVLHEVDRPYFRRWPPCV